MCLIAFKAAKWRLWVRHDHSWKCTEKLIPNYQTVSRRGVLQTSPKQGSRKFA